MTTFELLTVIGIPSIIYMIFQVVFNYFVSKNKKNKDDDTAIRKGIQALLRKELMEDYKIYMSKKAITISEKENYNNMYHSYHNLGKNGVMDAMYNEVMDLPIQK